MNSNTDSLLRMRSNMDKRHPQLQRFVLTPGSLSSGIDKSIVSGKWKESMNTLQSMLKDKIRELDNEKSSDSSESEVSK